MKIFRLDVDSIHCEKCAYKIKESVSSLSGVKKVEIFSNKRVIVFADDDVDKDEVKDLIESLGYKVLE